MAKKLLLADDSVTIQKVVNLTFADEGIEVVTVSDGNAAIEVLSTSKPDIVIADVNMPGLNGYQLCEKIKNDEALKDIPVILLVGSFEPFDEEKARKVGADDFLTKPFQSIRQLIGKVSALLEARRTNGKSEAEKEEVKQETGELKQEPVSRESVYESEFEGFAVVAEDETIREETLSTFEQAQTTYEEKTERDLAVTTPLSTEDVKEIQFEVTSTKITAETTSTELPAETTAAAVESSGSVASETVDTAVTTESTLSQTVTESTEATTEIERSQDIERVAVSAEERMVTSYDVEAREESVEVSQQEEKVSVTEESARIEEKAHFETETLSEEIPSPEKVLLLDLEEDEILELPSLPRAEVSTETFVQEAEVEETRKMEELREERRESEVVKPQTITLPPEVIDAIAEKVVEKFAEKTIKEIAWEVVPQQAELIIKKMVEEQLRKQKTDS